MKKRAQVTVFIILGIVIVVILALFISLQRGLLKGRGEVEIEKKLTFADKVEQVKVDITSCIEQQTKTAINKFGLYANSINQYVQFNLASCINFANFPDLDITTNSLITETTISEFGVNVLVYYPTTIKKGGDIANLEEFPYTFDLLIDVDLESSNGITTDDKWLYSEDDKAVLFIPKNTKVTLNGAHVEEITMQMTNCLRESCFGPLAYDLLPKGTLLEPPAQLTIQYDESFLLPGQQESELEITRTNKNGVIVASYECVVDTVNNKITAQVDIL